MSTASESWPWRRCRIYSLPFYYRTTNATWSISFNPTLYLHPPKPQLQAHHVHLFTAWGLTVRSMQQSTTVALLCHVPVLCTPAWGLLLMLVLEPTKRPFLTVISVWCQPLLHILAHARSFTSPSTLLYTDKICSRSQSGLAFITLLLGPLSMTVIWNLPGLWVPGGQRPCVPLPMLVDFHPWDLNKEKALGKCMD